MDKVKAFFTKVLNINPAILFGLASLLFYFVATGAINSLDEGPLQDMTQALVSGLWCAAYIVAIAICLKK